jgi:hypothetical protein
LHDAHPTISRFTAQSWFARARASASDAIADALHRAVALTIDPSAFAARLALLAADFAPEAAHLLIRAATLNVPPSDHATAEELSAFASRELWAYYTFDDAELASRRGLLSAEPFDLTPVLLVAGALRAGAYDEIANPAGVSLADTVTAASAAGVDAHFARHLASATGCIPALVEAVAVGETTIADAVAACRAATV